MKQEITSWIEDYVSLYPDKVNLKKMWGYPLTAFADAGDPLFVALKESVGPGHWLPEDILPGARSVVAYFLPFTIEVAESNKEGAMASSLWAKAYVETNLLIPKINLMVKEMLAERGYRAAYVPPTANFDHQTLISDWSHRHIAVIAGLGTFGRHNLLITDSGCCGRIGTIVTDLVLESDPRKSEELCIEKAGGHCGICVDRCVNGSLSEMGFQRHRCFEQCLENGERYRSLGEAWVCGKCLIGLPCSLW